MICDSPIPLQKAQDHAIISEKYTAKLKDEIKGYIYTYIYIYISRNIKILMLIID